MGDSSVAFGELPEEARRLLEPAPKLGLPVPAYQGASLPNVTSSVARAIGVDLEGPCLPPLVPGLDPFEGRRAEGPLVVLLVDGLGYASLARGAPAWAREGRSGSTLSLRAITSAFPTTTTVALTSLSTAAPPSWHGIVGHREFFPRFGSVVDLLRMTPIGVSGTDTLVGRDWTPHLHSGVPAVFRRGLAATALSRDHFRTSGFTRLVYDGAEYVGYASLSDFAYLLRDLLGRETAPSVVYAYWDDLDSVQHLRGPRADVVDFELGQVASLLAFARKGLSRSRAEATTVVLTADHGHMPVEAGSELAVDREPAVLEHLARPPSGDRRAGLFSARPGHEAALRIALAERLPAGTHIVSVEDALAHGLFGPPPFHPELKERLGDLLVLPAAPAGITYLPPGRTPGPHRLLGAHGGLEADELLVPLLTGPLSAWPDPGG